MISQDCIDSFSLRLKKILDEEINLGNQVVEASKTWLKTEAIIIILKQPFIGNYKIETVAYREINDIHYWKAEYFDTITNHVLACKF